MFYMLYCMLDGFLDTKFLLIILLTFITNNIYFFFMNCVSVFDGVFNFKSRLMTGTVKVSLKKKNSIL